MRRDEWECKGKDDHPSSSTLKRDGSNPQMKGQEGSVYPPKAPRVDSYLKSELPAMLTTLSYTHADDRLMK